MCFILLIIRALCHCIALFFKLYFDTNITKWEGKPTRVPFCALNLHCMSVLFFLINFFFVFHYFLPLFGLICSFSSSRLEFRFFEIFPIYLYRSICLSVLSILSIYGTLSSIYSFIYLLIDCIELLHPQPFLGTRSWLVTKLLRLGWSLWSSCLTTLCFLFFNTEDHVINIML